MTCDDKENKKSKHEVFRDIMMIVVLGAVIILTVFLIFLLPIIFIKCVLM
jgi:hypothetical protein